MDDHTQDGTPSPDDTTRSPAGEGGTGDESDLLVPWLRIQNFRGFRDLHIPRLGRVNLIVGKNSVGKSTVLEALRLVFDRDKDDRILKILEDRDQHRRGEFSIGEKFLENVEKINYTIESLFFGQPRFGDTWTDIEIITPERSCDISFQWLVNFGTVIVENQQKNNPHIPISSNSVGVLTIRDSIGYTISIKFEKESKKKGDYRTPLPYILERRSNSDSHLYKKKVLFINTSGVSEHSITDFWDRIALSDTEEAVTGAVRLVDNRIERIVSVSSGKQSDRILVAKIKEKSSPFTLKSLGEGAGRLFRIALALGNARDGILLLDEAENGLHWSVHPKLWDLVFHLAESLNVQVFATTHSYDCIKGFAAAARKHPSKGALIRLERQGDDVTARVLDEDTMAYAVEEDIEVR